MIERKLPLRLVLPLAIITVVSLALTWPPRLDDLPANLAVEIVGILITVLFVDWILRSREAERWRIADAQIRADFASTALRFLAQAALFFTDAGWKAPEVAKPSTQGKPSSFVLEDITLEEIHTAMSGSKQEDMGTFAQRRPRVHRSREATCQVLPEAAIRELAGRDCLWAFDTRH